MHWFYRIQQRIAITDTECNLILTFACLFGLGLVARHVQNKPQPLPQSTYATADRLFHEASGPSHAAAEAHIHGLTTPTVPEAASDTNRTATSKPASHPARSSTAALTPRMNLNEANASQLERLPRIGPKLAERILEYRRAHGPFKQVEDLVKIRGIGDKTLARLEPLLYVEKAE